MTKSQRSIRIETVAQYAEANRIYANCKACHRNAELDIDELITKVGNEFLFSDLAVKLTCSQCGSNDVDAFMSPRSSLRMAI